MRQARKTGVRHAVRWVRRGAGRSVAGGAVDNGRQWSDGGVTNGVRVSDGGVCERVSVCVRHGRECVCHGRVKECVMEV